MNPMCENTDLLQNMYFSLIVSMYMSQIIMGCICNYFFCICMQELLWEPKSRSLPPPFTHLNSGGAALLRFVKKEVTGTTYYMDNHTYISDYIVVFTICK